MIMTLVSCLGQNRYYIEIFLDMPVIGMISKILSIQAIQYAADMLFFVSPTGGGGSNPSVRHFSTSLGPKRVKCSKLWAL